MRTMTDGGVEASGKCSDQRLLCSRLLGMVSASGQVCLEMDVWDVFVEWHFLI